jgi:hypothetical protein
VAVWKHRELIAWRRAMDVAEVNCGEAYVSEEITAQRLEEAEEAVRARVQVDVRELAPA